MTNQTSLEVVLRFGNIGNKFMTVQLIHGDCVQDIVPDQNNHALISMVVKLPDQISLKFSGKDLSQDTKLDQNGIIVADLFVEIKSIALNGFKIPLTSLHKLIVLNTTDNRVIQTNYVGYNGIVTLDLPKETVFSQVLSWKKLT